jgi:translation initiation factor IF-3
MWKKENEFLKEKQRFEKKKIQMENEIKKMRMKAKFENHDNSIENTLARQD